MDDNVINFHEWKEKKAREEREKRNSPRKAGPALGGMVLAAAFIGVALYAILKR